MFSVPAAASNRRTRTKKRDVVKTKVCSYFEAGNCKKGERCDFLHGSEQSSEAPAGGQAVAQKFGIEDRMSQLMPWLASGQGFASKPIWASEGSQTASTDGGERSQPLSSVASEDGTTSENSDDEWRRPLAKDVSASPATAREPGGDDPRRLCAADEPVSLLVLECGSVFTVRRMRF